MTTATKPRWTLAGDRRRGEAAYSLATADRTVLEPRLTAGLLDALRTDLDALPGAAVSSATHAGDQKTATADEREAAKESFDLVRVVRDAAKRRGGAALARKLGVGDGLRHSDTTHVLAALAAVVNAAGSDGAGLAGIGVTQDDIAEANALGTRLTGADAEQWKKLVARKEGTADALVLRRRIEHAVVEIAAVGPLAFRKNAARRAEYEALLHDIAHEAEPEAAPEAPVDPAAAEKAS